MELGCLFTEKVTLLALLCFCVNVSTTSAPANGSKTASRENETFSSQTESTKSDICNDSETTTVVSPVTAEIEERPSYYCDPSLSTGGRVASNITWDDATWILTSSFIIFTMQSGFGLLESGSCSMKNEVNIMVKNAVDVIFGGVSFWMFGFGVAFDDTTKPDEIKNSFTGIGPFFVDADEDHMGYIFSCFIFQLSFATTATTIVSGAMAERTKLGSYIIFSFLNTAIYCFPAYWIWAPHGFLRRLGALDIAGAGAVHLVGGSSGLVATVLLKPRHHRFKKDLELPPMGCPTNVLLGLFMLWWGWLGFNCGSTFGISGGKWKLAARSAVATVMSSMGGGCIGILFSFIFRKRKFDVGDLVNGILGSLVSITAMCALAHPWESIIIGTVGGALSISTLPLLAKLRIDDPVGVIPVHGVCAVWGMLSVGLFVQEDTIECTTQGNHGLFRGGGFYLLGIQALACVCIASWSLLMSFLLLKSIDLAVGLRVSLEDELIGADITEHGIQPSAFQTQPTSPAKDVNQNGTTHSIKRSDSHSQRSLDLHERRSRVDPIRRSAASLYVVENGERLDSAADDSVLYETRARERRMQVAARRPSLGVRHWPSENQTTGGGPCSSGWELVASVQETRCSNDLVPKLEGYSNPAVEDDVGFNV